MQLTPSRPLAAIDPAWWRRLRIASLMLVAIVNAFLVVVSLFVTKLRATDWAIMQRAGDLAGSPELYELRGIDTFVWSPVSAYVLNLLDPLSFGAWQVILILGGLAMPTWRLRILVLISWPFWQDWIWGNLLTFIFLAAVYAWRGSRIGTVALFAFTLLIPRPLLVPMAGWILWKRPAWRLPFVAMFAVHAILVLWTGLGEEWIHTLTGVGPEFMDLPNNRGPSRHFGLWWFAVGAPLAVWLFHRGRVGWAGLAISPYVWAYYLFWVLPDVNRPRCADDRPSSSRSR